MTHDSKAKPVSAAAPQLTLEERVALLESKLGRQVETSSSEFAKIFKALKRLLTDF